MRPFAGELASAVSVCAVAAALTFELPSAAYSFRAGPDEQPPTENGAFAAYVFMDAPTEAFFLRKAYGCCHKSLAYAEHCLAHISAVGQAVGFKGNLAVSYKHK